MSSITGTHTHRIPSHPSASKGRNTQGTDTYAPGKGGGRGDKGGRLGEERRGGGRASSDVTHTSDKNANASRSPTLFYFLCLLDCSSEILAC